MFALDGQNPNSLTVVRAFGGEVVRNEAHVHCVRPSTSLDRTLGGPRQNVSVSREEWLISGNSLKATDTTQMFYVMPQPQRLTTPLLMAVAMSDHNPVESFSHGNQIPGGVVGTPHL